MTTLAEQQIVERLLESGPFANEAETRRALRVCLEVLGSLLTSDERALVGGELSPELAQMLHGASPHRRAELHEFAGRIAQSEGVPWGVAVEHAEMVCRAVGNALSPSTRQRLVRGLPQLARLFEPLERPEIAPLPEERRPDTVPNDLAEGRPGGTLPLASADPRYLAHRHSVVRSVDPHAETKLSSAHGLRQEQDEHTLALGRPGSEHPISSRH